MKSLVPHHLAIQQTHLIDRFINTADVGMPAYEGQQCAESCLFQANVIRILQVLSPFTDSRQQVNQA
jgi:hypothetical protein